MSFSSVSKTVIHKSFNLWYLKKLSQTIWQSNSSTFPWATVESSKSFFPSDINILVLKISLDHCSATKTSNNKGGDQKQPSKGILKKRCSGNMKQIYRRTPMPKSNFNRIAKQLSVSHPELYFNQSS